MGLKLTGKGSILDAIGGGLNTAGNAVVAGVKDVGDLADEGLNSITGNAGGSQNASNAIKSNDSNVSGGNFVTNLGGLSEDVGATQAARAAIAAPIGLGMDISGVQGPDALGNPSLNDLENFATNKNRNNITSARSILGNTAMTALNLVTAAKGKALAEGIEGAVPGVERTAEGTIEGSTLARAGARVIAGAGTAGAYGAGQGGSNAIATAQNPAQAVSDVVKPALQNAALGGVIAGVTTVPSLASGAKDNAIPLSERGSVKIPGGSDKIPNPTTSEEDVAKVQQSNPLTPAETPDEGEPLPEEPGFSSQELQQATETLHQDMTDPTIDWTQVSGAAKTATQMAKDKAEELQAQYEAVNKRSGLLNEIRRKGGVGSSDYEEMPRSVRNKNGGALDDMAAELGYKDDQSLHDAILAEDAKPSKMPSKAAWLQEADNRLRTGTDPESLQYQKLLHHAKAEIDYDNFLKADKASGYDKTKNQILKGVPARRFIKRLWDKTHSPEFMARNAVGADLGDTRDTLKMVKANLKDAQSAFDQGGISSEVRETLRSNLAEQKAKYTFIKGRESTHSLAYRRAAEALDDKYPDINLAAKKGVRLTANQPYETARPVTIKSDAESTAPSISEKPQEGSNVAEVLGRTDESKPYTGPNLNEGAFSKEDMAALGEKESATQRNLDGERAMQESIKNGDSLEDVAKAYTDNVPGATAEDAAKALGIIQKDPNMDTVGRAENNPLHGDTTQVPDYDVKEAAPGRLAKVFLRGEKLQEAYRNSLINKALARATGYQDQLASKLMRASRVWKELSPEDQELADKLRNNSIEDVAKDAKDPEKFTDYANRAANIQDFIHEARRIADPWDTTKYRQQYGAGFHTTSPDGTPYEPPVPKEGQDHSYQEERHLSTYDEIQEATGRVRSTQDFHEDLTKDVVAAQHIITEHSLLHGLRQAFGDNAASYGGDKMAAHQNLTDFKNIATNKDIAERINSKANHRYSSTGVGSLAKGYDVVNKSMKDVKLSLGGFHNINIMLSHVALDPATAGKAIAAWGNPKFFNDAMDHWDENGTLGKALHTGLTLGGGEEFTGNESDVKGISGKLAINNVPGIKQAHAALFERQIPFSKMATFEKYAKDLNLNNPADYDKMRGISRGINNMYGGINRLLDGLTPGQFKVVSRAVLAADYNEGQIRTLLSVAKEGPEGAMARQMVAGRAAMLAAPGTIQAFATGQIHNPKQATEFVLKQLVSPTFQTTNWKTGGGNPKQIEGLATISNKAYRAIAPFFDKNNPDHWSGVASESKGNLAALPAFGEEEKLNSDFYGNPMHGNGLNAAEDVGQALNAAAPIPASPVGRALANTHFNQNPVVKILSGGQSGISPGEAAVDISGIGRVSANPDSPEMVILNRRQEIAQGLNTQDASALQQVHPSWSGKLTKAQEAAIYSNPNYEINKWNVLRQNGNVYNALEAQNKVAEANGEPSDPLLALQKSDYKTVAEYEFLKHADEGPDANNTAAVIYAQNKNMIDKYETDNATYETQMNALYNKTAGTKGESSPVESVGGAPNYTPTAQQQSEANTYYAMNDSNSTSTQRAQYLTDNPDLVQLMNIQFAAENKIRAQQGEPQLKPFPEASSTLNTWINNYTAASKTSRTAMRDADPTSYNDMSTYFAQVDEYDLAKTAGQAQFQDENLSQANLKQIYDLGQYDINPEVASDGSTSYQVNPQAAYANSSSGSGSSGSNSEVQKLLDDIEREHAVQTVRFMGRKAYIRKQSKSRKIYLPQPKLVKVGNKAPVMPSMVKIRAKSVPVP